VNLNAENAEPLKRNPNVKLDTPHEAYLAAAYLRGLVKSGDVARQDQGGDNRTLEVFNDLLDHVSGNLALKLMSDDWNAHCEPPWSEAELEIKCGNAEKYRQNDVGCCAIEPPSKTFAPYIVAQNDNEPSQDNGRQQFEGLGYYVASSVTSKPINWIWPGRFAAGMVGIIAGNPDTGKSTIAYDMAAKISNGDTWPFGEGTADQGAVIILSGEDSRERIIKPRLMAAGANLDQVIMLEPLVKEEGGRRMLNLADDLERIAGLIEELRGQGRVVRMLDIDPISAYLGRSDSYKNAEMRMLLTPLAEWAERMQIGVLVVTHLNKNGGSTNALGRVTDSLAIAALSRTAWLTAVEKDDEGKETGRVLFMRGKNNISPRDISNLAYRIESVTVRLDDGSLSSQPKIMWDACVATTAEEVLAPSYGKASKLDKAEDFLRYALANGPVLMTKIHDLAEGKHSWKTITRAKKALGIISRREGFGRDSEVKWALPGAALDPDVDPADPDFDSFHAITN
jgi:putative DNA primase/helicase